MAANQSAPGLNRRLLSNFWWLRSANYVKFTEEYMIYTEKHVLLKNVNICFKHGFGWGNKSIEWKHTVSRKEVPGVAVSKEGHADRIMRYEKISLKKVQL